MDYLAHALTVFFFIYSYPVLCVWCIYKGNYCWVFCLQVSALRPVLSLLNGTFGEVLKLFGNSTQQSGTVGSLSVYRAASILFCQHELLLNQTSEQKQYLDKFRPDQETSVDSVDNSSTYDNSTSESICDAVLHCSKLELFRVFWCVQVLNHCRRRNDFKRNEW